MSPENEKAHGGQPVTDKKCEHKWSDILQEPDYGEEYRRCLKCHEVQFIRAWVITNRSRLYSPRIRRVEGSQ